MVAGGGCNRERHALSVAHVLRRTGRDRAVSARSGNDVELVEYGALKGDRDRVIRAHVAEDVRAGRIGRDPVNQHAAHAIAVLRREGERRVHASCDVLCGIR